MYRTALTVALLATSLSAMAQESGALSLTRPVGKAQVVSTPRVVGSALALGGDGPREAASATSIPDMTVDPATPAAALPAAYPTVAAPTMPLQGDGTELTIRPGRTEMVQIARNHLNRFVTPFARPEVQSSAQATSTKVEGSVVYVATASPEPIGIFIVDGDNPANAFSMTLMPRETPPVSMTLRLASYAASPAPSGAPAGAEDSTSSYVAELRETFRALASGEIPRGFGMRPIAGRSAEMPDCVLPGLQAVPAQEISGGEIVVIVSRLTNVSTAPLEVNESRCASDRVLAVAAWPHVALLPGQSTELYIAIRRAAPPAANSRPSVLR